MAAELGAGFSLNRALVQGLISRWSLTRPTRMPCCAHTLRCTCVRRCRRRAWYGTWALSSRFLEAVSFSHAAILNVSNLARECQVERKVAEGYVEVLSDLLLAFTLPVFTRRARRRMTTHPKIYLVDAGLCRSLRPTGPLDRPEELAGAGSGGSGGPAPARLDRLLEPRRHPELLANPCRQRGGLRSCTARAGCTQSRSRAAPPSTHGTSADCGRSRRTIRSRRPCCSTAVRAASRSVACSVCRASRFSVPSLRRGHSRKPSHPCAQHSRAMLLRGPVQVGFEGGHRAPAVAEVEAGHGGGGAAGRIHVDDRGTDFAVGGERCVGVCRIIVGVGPAGGCSRALPGVGARRWPCACPEA